MAAMKTMVAIALDVSPSMGDPVAAASSAAAAPLSKLQFAKNFLSNFILGRMLASKTAEFAVLAFGSAESHNFLHSSQGGYDGVDEVVAMARPSAETLCALDRGVALGPRAGDIIDAVVVAQDILLRTHATHTFNRVLVLVTDAAQPVAGVDDLELCVQQMRSVPNFALYIAVVGDAAAWSPVQRENVKLLHSVAGSLTNARCAIVASAADAVRLLSSGLGLGTKPQLSKLPLLLRDDVGAACVAWTPVAPQRAPPLKKAARRGAGDSAVRRDLSYRDPDDADLEISAMERVKGFAYGPQFVPLSAADEAAMKVNAAGGAAAQIIGFVAATRVSRPHLLDAALVLAPAPGDRGARALLAALSAAMRDKGVVALTRLVKRAGGDPILAVLAPRAAEAAAFLLHRLPFADDVRDYNFPSLVALRGAAPDARLGAVADAVKRLTVAPPAPLPATNAALQAIYAEVTRKICGAAATATATAETAALPTEERDRVATKVYRAFALETNVKPSRKRKQFWSDVAAAQELAEAKADDGDDAVAAPRPRVAEAPAVAAPTPTPATLVAAVAEPTGPGFTVGSPAPLEEFAAFLVQVEEEDLSTDQLRDGLRTMQAIVERTVTCGASAAAYQRAVDCLAALRAACVRFALADDFNAFFAQRVAGDFRCGPHAALWTLLQQRRLSLIHADEVHGVHATRDDADALLRQPPLFAAE